MVSRSFQGRLSRPITGAASADRSADKGGAAWDVPDRVTAAAPPSAVPITALRGIGECFPGCEVIFVLQT
ncbi:hypothetical protein GCM10017771_72740 [Streptomyces capitiformicae]|uniref:Uncharacterized protein n=1 Tax=Streptomyces capitiformicae TaxID=2014920 RepID=A0A919DKC7_9ACTN|nr:hypothetical protein GCM10017771_72740 [Streptomyces capitiformicae]